MFQVRDGGNRKNHGKNVNCARPNESRAIEPDILRRFITVNACTRTTTVEIPVSQTYPGKELEIEGTTTAYTVTFRNTYPAITTTTAVNTKSSRIGTTGTPPAPTSRIASIAKLSGFTRAIVASQPGMAS